MVIGCLVNTMKISGTDMINEINDMLTGIGLSEQDIERWWNSRNKAFDEQKPIDVFQVFPRHDRSSCKRGQRESA